MPRYALCFLCTHRQAYSIVHKTSPQSRIGAHTTEKPGRSLEGGESKGPCLTIDQIVVPRRTQGYTPTGVSLYARWLLLGPTSPPEHPTPRGPLCALLSR